MKKRQTLGVRQVRKLPKGGRLQPPQPSPWIHPEWIFLEQNQLNLARTDQKIVGQGV